MGIDYTAFLCYILITERDDTRCNTRSELKSLNIKLCGKHFDSEDTRFCKSHLEIFD